MFHKMDKITAMETGLTELFADAKQKLAGLLLLFLFCIFRVIKSTMNEKNASTFQRLFATNQYVMWGKTFSLKLIDWTLSHNGTHVSH